jgi:thiol:disulfide interchange protein DsbC
MSIPNWNNFRARKYALAAVLAAASHLGASSTVTAEPLVPGSDPAALALRQSLAQRYPNTQFGDIHRTPIPGLWEVWMGANVAYATDEGRHFIFGHLYDMQTQTDLTAAKREQASVKAESTRPKLTFNDLPLGDAIKTVRGSGARKLAVFSDPHCSYCRQLEGQLAKIDNVTVYTFLFPLDSIHPEAASVARSIWCAADNARAWRTYMATGVSPKPAKCESPIERNVRLATNAGIAGTPFLLFANGANAAGALPVAELEQRLSRQ